MLVTGAGFLLQRSAERDALTAGTSTRPATKEQREVDKLAAEVKRIRSDTEGSLYWLKLAAVFVTVGAAVGGYLVAQSRTVRAQAAAEGAREEARQDFERRARVDTAGQSIVGELSSDKSTLLRATAAMKLGKLLKAPPGEWHLDDERRSELSSLTKQILAASLAIESDAKVLKALTIAVALHGEDAPGDLRELDFSLAQAADAYWAKIDFTAADFYKATLTAASFRNSTLAFAQFRETVLTDAVLSGAICRGTNFKYSDLRNVDLSGADLTGARFEGTKVYGVVLRGATIDEIPEFLVDISPDGDGQDMVSVSSWLRGAVQA